MESTFTFNDPNSSNRYRYENGQTQKQVDGEWKTIDANEVLSDFVVCTIAGVNGLENSGNTGAGLVGGFYGEGKDVTFQYRAIAEGGNQAKFAGDGVDINTIYYDNRNSGSSFTTGGYDFVTIGHEMAHLTGPREFTEFGGRWVGNISRSEIRATHYENLIRQEAGLPLRTYYGETFNKATGKSQPLTATRLIDRAGNSIYYSHDPKQMAPGSIPTLIQEGLNVSKRPLTGRYNYYEKR